MEGSLISDPLLGITPLTPNSDKRLNQTLRSRNKMISHELNKLLIVRLRHIIDCFCNLKYP